jgi:5-methylcytosine-specific restriction endonuclease McrA
MALSLVSKMISQITNDELLQKLKTQVENERKLLMEILECLREVENRKLHLELGYPDLYMFAMKELGYTSGAAYRRISAMRLLKSLPDIAPRLESGELGLENASQAQSFFRKEDQNRKEKSVEKLTLQEKREVVLELVGKSTREGQRILLERSPEAMTPTEKFKPLPSQKTLVQFVADEELMCMLEELKNLLAHQNYEGRMDVLMKKIAGLALEKLKSKGRKNADSKCIDNQVQSKTSTQVPAPSRSHAQVQAHMQTQAQTCVTPSPAPGKMRSRYISASVKRHVRLRDQNGCTYRDPKTGQICQSKHGLQLDHIVPFSLGGAHSVENLTLLCGAHNRFRAEKMGLYYRKTPFA